MTRDDAIDKAEELLGTCRDAGFLARTVRRLLRPHLGPADLEMWEARARQAADLNSRRALGRELADGRRDRIRRGAP